MGVGWYLDAHVSTRSYLGYYKLPLKGYYRSLVHTSLFSSITRRVIEFVSRYLKLVYNIT